MMSVEVTTPEEYLGDVMGDLNSRRGKIEGFYVKEKMLRLLKRWFLSLRCSVMRQY